MNADFVLHNIGVSVVTAEIQVGGIAAVNNRRNTAKACRSICIEIRQAMISTAACARAYLVVAFYVAAATLGQWLCSGQISGEFQFKRLASLKTCYCCKFRCLKFSEICKI